MADLGSRRDVPSESPLFEPHAQLYGFSTIRSGVLTQRKQAAPVRPSAENGRLRPLLDGVNKSQGVTRCQPARPGRALEFSIRMLHSASLAYSCGGRDTSPSFLLSSGNTLPLACVRKATGKISLICVAEIPITENPNLFSHFTNGKHSDENFLYLEIH